MVSQRLFSRHAATVSGNMRGFHPGVSFEIWTSVRWNGKERRKGGKAEELRLRIDQLKREWDAQPRSGKGLSKRHGEGVSSRKKATR
jgi:hypothetical protein